MSIMLGDLSINDIQTRLGVDLPPEFVEYLTPRHQPLANHVAAGEWHCFDIPFMLLCGDRDTAAEVYRHLAPLGPKLKTPMQIGHR